MATRTNAAAERVTGSAQVSGLGERLLIRLPDEASRALPSRGQVAVHAELNGHVFDAVLEPDGRKGHWLPVDAQLQAAASLREGTAVEFTFTRRGDWPEPEVPADLEEALASAPEARAAWQDITPMARWEWVRWVGATKNAQTRARRVEVTISKLEDGKRRPCCFDLASCTDPEVARSGKLIELG
ncbi:MULTISPECIES: YdeI/OmpD-associated family protein [Brevibacterium]|uniref:YdeI/OmpD-associated family protein n=1 Tax=Brevibacterium salitolerans TaxID=1403566 RepID=A0ABN2WAA3_9MICO|nr:YdeI/OmpD-associated family protein [Brevibacterium sp.]